MKTKPGRLKQAGNTTILVIALVAIATFVIAFVVWNTNQLQGLHKEAQNAIDASSLAAAKEMTSIVVDGPMGRMALAEDPEGDSKWPVYGVNTVMATLRVDAIIARELNNKTLAYLVQNDLTQTNQALSVLTQRIKSSAAGGTSAYDRNGKQVNIRQKAYDAYIASNKAMAGTTNAPENFTITLGTISAASGQAKTNTPIPNPESLDTVSFNATNSYSKGSQKYYLGNVDISVPGMPVSAGGSSTVRFAPVGNQPALLEQGLFSQLSGSDVPIAVQVSCDQPVKAIADPKVETSKTAVHTTSYAQAGNRAVLQQPGVLEMAFPAGIPTNPVSVSGGTVDFSSVKSIMNSSTSDVLNGQLQSTKSGWTDSGKWYQVKGGPNPGGGTLEQAAFKGIKGLDQGDPSLALNCCVYDWLRSCTNLPNIQKVLDVLDSKFALSIAMHTVTPSTLTNNLFQPTYAQQAPPSAPARPVPAIMAPTAPAITTAILTILPETLKVPNATIGDALRQSLGTIKDPRDLSEYNSNAAAFDRQQANMWGYLPADGTLPAGAAVVSIGYDGTLKTSDGNPYQDLLDFLNALDYTNSSAVVVNQAVMDILKDVHIKEVNEKVASLNTQLSKTTGTAARQALINEIADVKASTQDESSIGKTAIQYLQKPEAARVLAALINSTYVMEVTNSMINNMKSLTGTGVKKLAPNHFIIGGADFYPAQYPWPFGNSIWVDGHGYMNFGANAPGAAKSFILAKDVKFPIQVPPPTTPISDWCAPPVSLNGMATSPLNIYKHNSNPVITMQTKSSESHFLPPVLAQSAAPPLAAFFHYQLVSTSSKEPGKFEAKLAMDKNSPYTNVPTGKGQTIYQSTSGLVSDAGADSAKAVVIYQIQAKDQFANAYPSTEAESSPNPNAASDYFGSLTPQGAPVAAIWAITCPQIPPPPPPKPPDEIPLFTTFKSGVGYQYYYCHAATGIAWWGLAWYPWGVATIVPGDGALKTPVGMWQIRRFGAILHIPPTPSIYAT